MTFFPYELRAALAVLSALVASLPVLADEAPDDAPDEIVVVANKDVRRMRDVAAHVTVLARDQIREAIAVSAADVFRYAPGIDYDAAGTRFGDEGITIRGIGGNRVAVLIDGVPLGDQFAVGSFSNATRDFLNAGLIDRVEVLHGPASALYGSSAIGGVVAVQTPEPADIARRGKSGGDLQAVWRASDDSVHQTALLALNDAGTGVLLGGSLRNGAESASAAADSLDFRDYRRRSALGTLVHDDARGGTWRIGIVHQDAAVTSDLNAPLGSGRYRSTTALKGDDNYRMQLVHGAWEFGDAGGLVDSGILRAYSQSTDVRQRTLDERGLAARPAAIDRYFRFQQDIRGIELNLRRSLATGAVEHRLGLGLEFRERTTEELRDGLERGLYDKLTTSVILGEAFPLRDFPRSESREWGAYVEDTLTRGNGTLIAALRADRYTLSPLADAMFAGNYPFARPVSLSETDISPRLALMYRLGDAVDLYLQYARGFRAPPYEDANIGLDIPAFNYRAIPNPQLRSESSDGFELGLRWHGSRLRLHAALFRTDYDDFIESRVRIGTDPDSGRILFQAQNIDSAVITGLEAGWEWQLDGWLRQVRIDGSLYGARGENRDTGQPLNSVGPAQLIGGVAWQAPGERRGLRVQVSRTAAWTDRDETGGALFKPAAHTVVDLYLTQHIGQRVTLRAGILNLTDRVAWQKRSVRGLPADDVLIPHLAAPGRSVAVNAGLNW